MTEKPPPTQLEIKRAEVDRMEAEESARIREIWKAHYAAHPPPPKPDFEKHPSLQFEEWEWGYAEDTLPGLQAFWEEANKNGARVAVEMMMQSQAFIRRIKTKDGKTEWDITIGPLVLKFDEAKIDEEENDASDEEDDYRVVTLPLELGEEWLE